MPQVQKNGGVTNGSTSIVTSLGVATTAGHSIFIMVAGAGTITTPAGFTSRSPQVNTQGHYFFEKLTASGNATDTPTMTMSGAFNAVWHIAQYSGTTAFVNSNGNFGGFVAAGAYTSASITPSAGNRLIFCNICSTSSSFSVPFTGGSPSAWTNSFVAETSTQVTGTSGSGRDAIVSGWSTRQVTTAGATAYTTAATLACTNTVSSSSIIVSYTHTAGAAATSLPPFGSRKIFFKGRAHS